MVSAGSVASNVQADIGVILSESFNLGHKMGVASRAHVEERRKMPYQP